MVRNACLLATLGFMVFMYVNAMDRTIEELPRRAVNEMVVVEFVASNVDCKTTSSPHCLPVKVGPCVALQLVCAMGPRSQHAGVIDARSV